MPHRGHAVFIGAEATETSPMIPKTTPRSGQRLHTLTQAPDLIV
jgi:hypothetical protein